MKRVTGYIRDIPGGDPLVGISVAIQNMAGVNVPVGGMIGAGTNPVNTDANGRFVWTTELSPGPVKAVATISGSEKKVRVGAEVMQAGDAWISDLEEYLSTHTDGVAPGLLSQLAATASGSNRDLTVQAGRAIVGDMWWGIDGNRVLTGAANTTLPTRRDLIVLRQYVAGSEAGRQDLVLVPGTVDGVDPVLNGDPNITELAIWRGTLPQNASTYSVLTDLRTYARPILAAGALVTADLADLAVTAAKIAAGAVTATQAPTLARFLDLAVQSSADNGTNPSAVSWMVALSHAFTLPAGTWNVALLGQVLMENGSAGGADVRCLLDGVAVHTLTRATSQLGTSDKSPSFTGGIVPGVAAGAHTASLEHKANSAGSSLARNPFVVIIAVRTA